MRILVAAVLVLCCSLCLAEDLPKYSLQIKSLTAEQAAELMAWRHKRVHLRLDCLTSIDKDVAQELAKFEGGLWLDCLDSIDKDVAEGFAKFKGEQLSLRGYTSIDKDVLEILQSNPNID